MLVKKLLAILVLVLLCLNVSIAEIKIIEKATAGKLRKSSSPKVDSAFPATRLCVDGLEFLVIGQGVETSVTQVFETRAGSSLPKNCFLK